MSTIPNDDAYPIIAPDAGGLADVLSRGLTKREHFAALAMQGLMACPDVSGKPEMIAGAAVIMADALVQALNRPVTERGA